MANLAAADSAINGVLATKLNASQVNSAIEAYPGVNATGTVTSVAGANGIKVTGTATTTPVVEIDTSAVFILNCGTASENID